jgi:nitrogen fixation NifU-like protein
MAKYPAYLLEHFRDPKNVGEILNPDGIGTACNVSCGDIMQMFIKCNGDKISEVTFKTFGCGAAIAASSILTERIKGSTVDEALKISEGILEEILSQVPEEKIPCFKLAAHALRLAIEEYTDKRFEILSPEPLKKDRNQQ